MLGAEKSELLNALRAGREVLGHALANVDEALAHRTPDSAGWSILQCMEHMVESERYLLSRLRRATAAEHQQENRAREAKIAAIAADRTHHIQAPEMVRPVGRFSTLSEALAAFDVTRAEVVAWVEECSDNPRCLITDHPLIPGPVTCYETLLMMAAHPGRHAKQIEEIHQTLSY
jgi:hypothetical protein